MHLLVERLENLTKAMYSIVNVHFIRRLPVWSIQLA
jgi:hypothetical protein